MKTYTATTRSASAQAEPREVPTIRNPESHATVQGLQRQLEEFALKMEKGSKLFDQLDAVGDPRADAVAEKIATVSAEYMKIHEEWDALLGPSGYGCIECKRPPDIWKVSATARLCSVHAISIRATRARLKAV